MIVVYEHYYVASAMAVSWQKNKLSCKNYNILWHRLICFLLLYISFLLRSKKRFEDLTVAFI